MARKKTSTSRVTIRTVAEHAGVSVAAVSKVLRDAYGVSEQLRARVRASMNELDYRPLAAARAMRGQTYTLGLLLPDLINPFFADIMAGVNTALERTQYQPMLGISQSVRQAEQALVEAMIDRQMDGLIVIGPRMPLEVIESIAERTPVVLIAYHRADATTFDTVNDNDRLGAELVVRHLIEGGYRNIAMLSLELRPPEDAIVTVQREHGYRAAMTEAGQQRHINVIRSEQTPREVQAVVRGMLTRRKRPDAIFCWTDFIAFEALSVASELNLKVPDDIAIVGYDNTVWCELAQHDLTSIDQSGQVLGIQAARLLTERIKGRSEAEHFVVTPRLVARGSSRPLGARKR